jgi:ATP-dependent protease HslVU (ClpYQ) peptidase subunit
MTVIAYKDGIMAADKLSTFGTTRSMVTKVRKVRGCLVGTAGDFSRALALVAWFERGAKEEDYPKFQAEDQWCDFMVVTPDRIITKYQATAHPIVIENQFMAIGSGSKYALAAMHLGYDAIRAVNVAIELDTSCGIGIDAIAL